MWADYDVTDCTALAYVLWVRDTYGVNALTNQQFIVYMRHVAKWR